MTADFTVVSIGALSSNPFWNEPPGLRTPHATTTLVRDGSRRILIDPSLPATALVQRLFERTGLKSEAITDVFCTTLRPTHRRAVEAFDDAQWWAGPDELSAYRGHLEALAAAGGLEEDVRRAVEADGRLLERFAACPDRLTEAVHLFPLPGPSAGSAGLLLAQQHRTVVVAGDAAMTVEHVVNARVWDGCADVPAAGQSLREILEIADLIVCGHDNYMISPTRWMG